MSDEARDRIDEVVDAVAQESKTICEITGKPGQLVRRGGYVMVRCKELVEATDVLLERTTSG